MSDTPEQNDNENKIPLSEDEAQKPQTGPLPAGDDHTDQERETLPARPPRDKRPRDSKYARDTTVFSKDSPLFKRALSQQQVDDDNTGEFEIGANREVIMLIRGMVERVVVVENTIYKLGRFEMRSTSPQEIDLTPYGALDRGVSRLHAQLHLEDDQLYITDLESTNGTYVSGNRIAPNEPIALKKGDELLLGRLTVQILFR